jgi:hypothetical protein
MESDIQSNINTTQRMTAEQIQLDKDIAEWKQLQEWMATAKERELWLRKSIADRAFNSIKLPTGAFPEGTTNHTFGTGLNNYKGKLGSQWVREVLEELIVPTLTEAALTIEQQGELIKMNPKLSVTAYRALPADKQRIIDKMINLKQGSITLEIQPLLK